MKLTSIMIVDDNEQDHYLTKYTINKYNPKITLMHAYDGQEALDMLEKPESKPNFILLDINMPGMNGIDFLEAYKKQKDHSAVIAMLTSSHQEDDIKKCLSFDYVKTYYVKPLSEADLVKLAEEL